MIKYILSFLGVNHENRRNILQRKKIALDFSNGKQLLKDLKHNVTFFWKCKNSSNR